MQLPEKDRYTQGKRKLLGMLVGLMGGRAAEELACSDITTGAQNDLKQATRIARLMVCEWGMSPALGPQSFGDREELLFLGREVSRSQDYSEATAQKIDVEVSRMLHEAYQKALDILRTHRDKLDLITQLLIERETLDGREVEELIEHGRILTPKSSGADTTGDTPTAGRPSPSRRSAGSGACGTAPRDRAGRPGLRWPDGPTLVRRVCANGHGTCNRQSAQLGVRDRRPRFLRGPRFSWGS
jgi:cell division protease FtsH